MADCISLLLIVESPAVNLFNLSNLIFPHLRPSQEVIKAPPSFQGRKPDATLWSDMFVQSVFIIFLFHPSPSLHPPPPSSLHV